MTAESHQTHAADNDGAAFADSAWLKNTIVCPACLTPGVLENTHTKQNGRFCECARCHRFYPIDTYGVVDFQVPDMLLALPQGALEMWVIAQRRAAEEYRTRNPGSVASPERGAARAFGRFIDVTGKTVLDVGSGTDYFPAYMHRQASAQYVAVDPLPVEQNTSFTKVQAWAEAMPVATASFDVLLCGTSLDHVVCLDNALQEMSRVLRPGGTLYLWTALYADPKWFANLLTEPCFVREPTPGDRSFDTYLLDHKNLDERIANLEQLESNYGHLLVDRYHFRHLPVSFVKRLADYGFALRNLEVWEHNFHEGAIFLNAFAAFENHGRRDDRAAEIDHRLGVWSMLAGLTERLSSQRQEIGIIRDVVASGHRHTELAREELRAVAASIEPLTREQSLATQGLSTMGASLDAAGQQLLQQAQTVERIREEQAGQRALLEQLTQEQLRLAPLIASMNTQVQQLWQAAGLARLMSWWRAHR